jgi:prepilin-type N-terminal cleavage/methylation domain-containing protein
VNEVNQTMSMPVTKRVGRAGQRGFTLIELALASVILLVGIVAVAKLVPTSVHSNRNSRNDTTATVIAQRELDQMVSQPLTSTVFTDIDGNVINLGSAATPNVVLGGPLTLSGPNEQINFNVPSVAGYNYTYLDPNSPNGGFRVRWAVVVTVNGGNVVAKRFIVGCWRREPTQPTAPVTIESIVQR